MRRSVCALAVILAVPGVAQAAEGSRSAGTGAGVDAGIDSATNARTNAVTGTRIDSATNARTNAVAGTRTDSGTNVRTDAVAGTRTDAATDAGADVETDARIDAATDSPTDANAIRRNEDAWIYRRAPVANMGELGVYSGVFAPGRGHELFEANPADADQGYRAFARVAPAVGVRVGYYPLRFLGVEGEGGLMPTNAGPERATLWTVRGSAVAQVGLWSVTPFAVVGGGALAVASSRAAVGNDVDASVHVGGGLKFFLGDHTQVRFDVRDVISQRLGPGSRLEGDNIEATVSVAMHLGFASRSRHADRDGDGDGVLDRVDRCAEEAGRGPFGCPERDSDGDGVVDSIDRCVAGAGDGPDGCPPPDRDWDGVADTDDHCIDRSGFGGQGCPADFDEDGLSGAADVCEVEPETANGFEDRDGCPDDLPHGLAEISHAQVKFGRSRYSLPESSRARLDEVAVILHRYPEVRIAVIGHSDGQGEHMRNVALSGRRAQAVRAHLVATGIDQARIEIRALGPDQPLASNERPDGRAENRRTELEILH